MDRPTRPNMGSANARRDGFRIAWPYQLFVLCHVVPAHGLCLPHRHDHTRGRSTRRLVGLDMPCPCTTMPLSVRIFQEPGWET